ncbi:MAG: PAS-domain containing protein [Pseudomonadota bacterium]
MVEPSSATYQTGAVALLEDTFSGIDFGMALLDDALDFVLFNEAYVDLAFGPGTAPKVGDNAAELSRAQLERGVFALPEGTGPDTYAESLERAVRACRAEIPMRRADGRSLIASSKRTQLGGYLVSIKDTTDRDRAKAAEEARLQAITAAFDAMEEGVSLWDADLRFVACNDTYMRMVAPYRDAPFEVGLDAQSAIAEGYHSGLHDLDEDVTEAEFVQGYIDWARSHAGPIETRFKDGRTVVTSAKDTGLGGVLVTVMDVTRERNFEARALEMLSSAIESLDEGFALWDSERRFVMCNQRYVDLITPYRAKPFPVGTDIADSTREIVRAGIVNFPDDLTEDEIVADVEAFVTAFGDPREYHYKDGRIVVAAVKPTDLGGFLVIAKDVTEERNSEARARDMLLDAFQALDEGLVLIDENMNYVFGNDAWKRMMYEGQEHNIPQPGESIVESFTKLFESGFYAVPDGMEPDAYLAWILGELAQYGKQVAHASTDGRHFVGSWNATTFGGSLLFVRDVTRAHLAEAELAQQREMAHQTEKLSALGELLAGVAHELNNPLSVVFGYSQMMQGKVDDPVLSERIDLICQSSERAAKIVRTFLAMARQRPAKMEVCAVNDVLRTAIEVSGYAIKTSGTRVEVDLDPGDPHVRGDEDQLAQVFSNLILNAGQAVADKGAEGTITLRTRSTAGRVTIEIADNGPGIPKATQARIFEPFFTTKGVGEGTGIGLAFSHRIVESHDGRLGVVSEAGHGALFRVELATVAPDRADPEPGGAPMLHGHSVLVVDDEDGVAQLIADMLTEEGFRVTKTTDPEAALRLAARQAFDTILSDFKMPNMTGEAFFRALKAIAPENAARIGFITGDALSSQVVRFFDACGRPHIEKPIVRDELLALIQQASGEDVP